MGRLLIFSSWNHLKHSNVTPPLELSSNGKGSESVIGMMKGFGSPAMGL